MNSDIRISNHLPDHRKYIKLEKRIGERALKNLVCLWICASMTNPEGILTGWDEEDIAISARWEGNSKEFVDALIKCGWLERDNGVYKIHDWQDHQPWVCNARDRSEKAKKAACVRWKKNGK